MRFLILFFAIKLFAFNIFTAIKAEYDYKTKNYQKAAKEFLDLNTQKGLLNAGNCFYKLKEYKKAIIYYNQITNKDLLFYKYYNLANSYAQLRDFNKAITLYQKALKIKFDKDAKYNLEYIKKLLKKQPPPPPSKKKTPPKKQHSKNKQKNSTPKNNNSTHKKQNSKKQLTLKSLKKDKLQKKDLQQEYYEKKLRSLNFNTLLIPLRSE